MGFWLLVFFLTPIVEMYLLIEVGGYIGALPTIGLVMLTAVIGVMLLRFQGLATLTRGMGRLQGGELPAQELAEGLLLAVAGALLLTPGFVTDTVGFLLLFPPARAAVAARLLSRVEVGGSARAGPGRGGPGPGRPGPGGPGSGPWGGAAGDTIIEGEFERHPEDSPADDVGPGTPASPRPGGGEPPTPLP